MTRTITGQPAWHQGQQRAHFVALRDPEPKESTFANQDFVRSLERGRAGFPSTAGLTALIGGPALALASNEISVKPAAAISGSS
jgi:hypothetical protein